MCGPVLHTMSSLMRCMSSSRQLSIPVQVVSEETVSIPCAPSPCNLLLTWKHPMTASQVTPLTPVTVSDVSELLWGDTRRAKVRREVRWRRRTMPSAHPMARMGEGRTHPPGLGLACEYNVAGG
jgi:hypothetical protein